MGRFVAEGLLATTDSTIEADKTPVPLEDVLWAGKVEPRLLELLPAVVIKRPGMLLLPSALPQDLDAVVRALRTDEPCPDFRGIDGEACRRWVPLVGRRGHPSRLKSFRLKYDDIQRLARLRRRLAAKSDAEVVRLALLALERAAEAAERQPHEA
ncbi:MAG: hypothetical protein KC731_11245 [Myxococcales bacterium]|nr:hypothetical protein [Myxococcales bacterium]